MTPEEQCPFVIAAGEKEGGGWLHCQFVAEHEGKHKPPRSLGREPETKGDWFKPEKQEALKF